MKVDADFIDPVAVHLLHRETQVVRSEDVAFARKVAFEFEHQPGKGFGLAPVLYCFGRSGAPSVPATLEVAGVQLPVQAFHDTGFALQEPLSGKAVVLVQYPAVRHRLPQAARQYLDGWFAHSTAPPPPELGVHLVPCRSIHGQSMLPALPAALQLGKGRAGGLLAAFCCPTPPDPAWELLYGEDAAQLLL